MSEQTTHGKPPAPKRRLALVTAAVAGAGLLAAGAVHAQWDRDGWRARHHGPGYERGARFQRFCGNDTERFHPVVRAYVKADLRLDAGQGAQFDKLADQILPGLEALKREVCDDFTSRGGPTPERLAEFAGNLRQAADLAQSAVEPTRAFYASLDERQKARVDELAQRRGRMGPR